MVKGKRITFTEAVIAEVIGLPTEITTWAQKHVSIHDAEETFKDEGEQLVRKCKGFQPYSLAEPWKELASVIQK